MSECVFFFSLLILRVLIRSFSYLFVLLLYVHYLILTGCELLSIQEKPLYLDIDINFIICNYYFYCSNFK